MSVDRELTFCRDSRTKWTSMIHTPSAEREYVEEIKRKAVKEAPPLRRAQARQAPRIPRHHATPPRHCSGRDLLRKAVPYQLSSPIRAASPAASGWGGSAKTKSRSLEVELNFERLVLGCINADFRNQIFVGMMDHHWN